MTLDLESLRDLLWEIDNQVVTHGIGYREVITRTERVVSEVIAELTARRARDADVGALADLDLAARYPHIQCAKYPDLLDFHFAVDGSGPLANEWADKPHRLVYRLTGMLSDLRDARQMAKAGGDRG